MGADLLALGVTRALVVTDRGVAASGAADRVAGSLRAAGIEASVLDGVHIEPTDASLIAAAEMARASGPWDAFLAVGGGSSIDTAKAMNLLTSCPGDLMDYVNKPVGRTGARGAAQDLGCRAHDHRHRIREHDDLRP